MDSTWALGVSSASPRSIEIITVGDQRSTIDLEAAITAGIPSAQKSKRLLYEGDFSSWKAGCVSTYLAGFGVALPAGIENCHEVLTLVSDKGVTVHVPALVLMRAFFKPSRLVLPAVFSPAGIDLLSFVNYAATPPVVVIDDIACAKHVSKTVQGANQARAIEWLQLSKSARKMVHSTYRNAITGWLRLSLPQGRVRIAFHGRLDGEHLYATKATLISIIVPEDDSITGAREEIIFHAMVDADRKPTSSIRDITVPLKPDGGTTVTQAEWDAIEPLLKRKKPGPTLHSQRALLDVILHKLVSGLSWKKVPRGDFAVTDLTSAFRRWTTSGRLEKVLGYLEVARADR